MEGETQWVLNQAPAISSAMNNGTMEAVARHRDRAIVIGDSMAGLAAARVLSGQV
jgi:hypothetical protein